MEFGIGEYYCLVDRRRKCGVHFGPGKFKVLVTQTTTNNKKSPFSNKNVGIFQNGWKEEAKEERAPARTGAMIYAKD